MRRKPCIHGAKFLRTISEISARGRETQRTLCDMCRAETSAKWRAKRRQQCEASY